MNQTKIRGIAAAIGYFVLYACLMMAFQTLYTFGLMGLKFATGTRERTAFEMFATDNLLIAVLLAIVSVGLTFYMIFRLRGKDVRSEWRANPFTARALSLSILAALTYSVGFYLLSNYMAPETDNPIFHSADYYSAMLPGLGPVLMSLNLLIAAPAVEEIVMRGVVYTRIENACGRMTAIILNSLLFGLMHVSAGGLVLAVGAVLMGMVFALIFAKTNSLPACIIAHAAANLPDLVAYLYQ